MATRYLIAQGELLTYKIAPPKKRMEGKKRPYSLEDNKPVIVPKISAAADTFDRLPKAACPDDLAVAKLTLHPAYIAKSYFPTGLLRQAGLVSVGSRTQRVAPRKQVVANAPRECDTTQLFVAGTRAQFRRFVGVARELQEGTKEGYEFAEIEDIAPMVASDRIKAKLQRNTGYFEVGLHVPPDSGSDMVRRLFAQYARSCGFEISEKYEFVTGGLMFMPVQGDASKLETLAQFTLVRVVRPMPRIRAARPLARGAALEVAYRLPTAEPLSAEPKVAILDGGLPENHPLGQYVRRYFRVDEKANDSVDYVNHGLGVTSAFLFGPIDPGTEANRPYALVDHHRVLDTLSDDEDPLELYRTLGHVEGILASRLYQFLNLSLGPDLPIDDDDVHAWTAVIDGLLSDGEALLTVAVGNNGERDRDLRLDRIQVPADSVNAVSVGAVTHSDKSWKPANYSARGPGRSPGRRKPDVVAFGGSAKEYFHHVAPGRRGGLVANLGTSFAAPYVLRSAVGVRAVLGPEVHPLTIKALLVHGCSFPQGADFNAIGWGCVPNDLNELITCEDGVARIIYQGVLRPGKFLRAPVPLPSDTLQGNVVLSATFCYASPVDPQDSSAYTKAGLLITFRPHEDRRGPGAEHATSQTFFPATEFRTEEEQRADLGKWETVLHSTKTFRGSSLKSPTFDIHYNARDGAGGPSAGADLIPYALVLTLKAHRHLDLYDKVLAAHTVLRAIEPQIRIPIRT